MILPTTLSAITEHRHAELVSASMARGLMMVCAKKWTLSQALGDATIHKNALGMTRLGNNNHNGWHTLNPYNATQYTDIYNERKYL